MSGADEHIDPMFTTRGRKSCYVWLPSRVIDQVEARAKQEGISR